jgi:hypothetical protein
MNTLERLAPQMETYNRFGGQVVWCPYLMFGQGKNYRSHVINTDAYGFRLSIGKSGTVGLDDIGEQPCSLIIGNSVALGVGATSDAQTVSSLLSQHGEQWVNLTGRAYSSWQELIMFLAYRDRLPNIRRVIILSGLNDLYLSFAPRLFDENFGPFFYSDRFSEGLTAVAGRRTIVKQMLKQFMPRKQRKVDEEAITDRWNRRDTLLAPIRKTLSTWKDLASGAGFELTYALQPIAPFIDRTASLEERELINYFDSLESHSNSLAKQVLTKERYDWYRTSLAEICKKNKIAFTDLNEKFPREGWHFIDRFHLTDKGQQATADLLLKAFNSR